MSGVESPNLWMPATLADSQIGTPARTASYDVLHPRVGRSGSFCLEWRIASTENMSSEPRLL